MAFDAVCIYILILVEFREDCLLRINFNADPDPAIPLIRIRVRALPSHWKSKFTILLFFVFINFQLFLLKEFRKFKDILK